MKNIFCVLTALTFLISVSSCKKGFNNSNPLLGNSDDKMSGRVSVVTNNMQTKYGTFSSSSSLQGGFSKVNITSLNVEGYGVKENSTGQFFSQTAFDNALEQKFASFYGKSVKITLNGSTIMPDVPAMPYANVADISSLKNWNISKTKGLTLTWKIYSINSTPDATRFNNSRLIPEIEIPAQVEAAKTVVSIMPENLQHTTGKSQYWLVSEGATSFTIPPSVLTMYATNEHLNIVIGSGTESTYPYSIGNPVSFTALNTTMLPGLTLEP